MQVNGGTTLAKTKKHFFELDYFLTHISPVFRFYTP